MTISIFLEKVIETKCILGEGLFCTEKNFYWVDIENRKIFSYLKKQINCNSIHHIPSVIFDKIGNKLILGSDAGILGYDIKSNFLSYLKTLPAEIDIKRFRSNDGCLVNGTYYLGFMDRKDSENNRGFIYSFSKNRNPLEINNDISIPNGFIPISNSKLLICDSLTSEIWEFTLNKVGGFEDKRLWAKIDPNISPDGGCKVDKYILIAFWDDASIGVFDLSGNLLQRLPLEIPRPTNCKFLKASSKLLVTSAITDLNEELLKSFPKSGSTFIYKLRL